MKKPQKAPHKFETLSDAHRAFGLQQPKHPLISIISEAPSWSDSFERNQPHVLGFYKISYKPKMGGKLKYGQGYYDFDEGGLLFAAPGQIIGGVEAEETVCSNYTLLIHPGFFLGYAIAKKLNQYGFFSYTANETLHLSEEEKETILVIFHNIQKELDSRIDDLSHDVLISQIELLLNYANRFYKRQFFTRKAIHHNLLQRMDDLLNKYFNDNDAATNGTPGVQYLADELHVSPSYLSDMLRTITGKSAQHHIHDKLIEKAKEQLSTTTLSVSEVAYALGFEHSQSFSKLFKTKTRLSPLEFRRSFN